ncbi:MAG: HAD family hydrolase [Thermodesulfobacteriota bacterium]
MEPSLAGTTHVLFDFFGTLVSYSPSRTEQGYQRSHELLAAAGCAVDYRTFLERLEGTFEDFDRRTLDSLREFSMDEACEELLRELLPRGFDAGLVERLRDAYLTEWSTAVIHLPGVAAMLAELAERFTLVLVTNTHHAGLIHEHLQAMDAARHFTTVVTSVEHGKRKPSSCIFARALRLAGGTPETSLYVGDSYAADYVGATRAGLRCLLIDPERRHDVPETDRLAHVLDVRTRLLRREEPCASQS